MSNGPDHIDRDISEELACDSNPIGALKQMFVDRVMGSRIARGQSPVQRPVFLKPHGVAFGRLTVKRDLPTELRIGLLSEAREYPAWIRISSDTIPMTPDIKTTVGFGLKLFDVPGDKLIGNPGDTTHDFIFQNHDVFFVDTASDMCAFTKASLAGQGDAYRQTHPVTDQILRDMEKEVPSALGVAYWSVLPYALGSERQVKYKLEPELPIDVVDSAPREDPNYLAIDMRSRLLRTEVRFRFMLQLRTDSTSMPLDEATIRWSETISPPIEVATLTLPVQDIASRGQPEYGENLSLNPWRALEAHRPQGSISAARRVVYEAAAELRRGINGIPDGEPRRPKRLERTPAGNDAVIVKAKIHPPIGIARVGNAEECYFLAPEVIEPPPGEPGTRRDAHGALSRQATRFRIYGYNAAGEVVAELTTDNAAIEWEVELANLKAAWYQFQIALDIPEAAGADASNRRNHTVMGQDRSNLEIWGGRRRIDGRNAAGAGLKFDDGRFYGKGVYLGELKSDAQGRLIVLGGFGHTGHVLGAEITTFANNDGWHDDVADGPVRAKVSIAGRDIPVDPAWVVVAPPNYAPDLKSVRTLYDLLTDVFTDAGWLSPPEHVSFMRDILPIFRRLTALQWVNAGFATAFGYGGVFDFQSSAGIARLADASQENRAWRFQIATSFRDQDKDSWSPVPWPWIYGDGMDVKPFAHNPRQNTMLAKTQLLCLKRWAEGDFRSDYDPGPTPARSIDEVPLAEQPAMLDRAALEFCLADAFHPGCEMTWPMRHSTMYMAPFRIRHRRSDETVYPIGDTLTTDKALAFDGPLYGQLPGGLTRWMALPWHTDTASCRSQADYDPSYDPFAPTFWPARVPNQVIAESDYRVLMDQTKSRRERLAAFRGRTDWVTATLDANAGYLVQINEMLQRFGDMGLVEARPGPVNDPDIPAVIYASDGHRPAKPSAPGPALVEGAPAQTGPRTGFVERLGRFPLG